MHEISVLAVYLSGARGITKSLRMVALGEFNSFSGKKVSSSKISHWSV
jgi:hypothetical protein